MTEGVDPSVNHFLINISLINYKNYLRMKIVSLSQVEKKEVDMKGANKAFKQVPLSYEDRGACVFVPCIYC